MRPTNQLPTIFNQWKQLLKHWQDWLSHEKITQLFKANAAFAVICLKKELLKIIVGISSAEELLSIIQSKDLLLSDWPASLVSEDRKLINRIIDERMKTIYVCKQEAHQQDCQIRL